MIHKTKNKITALAVALICLFMFGVGILTACNKEIEPHDVEIVLINPHTGEPMAHHEKIAEPPAGTPIEVKIKDIVTGEYLTDDDLPETTLADSISIGINYRLDWDDLNPGTYRNLRNIWPELIEPYRVYEIFVYFDCRPDNPDNPQEFQRKYTMESMSFRFEYI